MVKEDLLRRDVHRALLAARDHFVLAQVKSPAHGLADEAADRFNAAQDVAADRLGPRTILVFSLSLLTFFMASLD